MEKVSNCFKRDNEKIARINIRLKIEDLEDIKLIADRKGIPYEALIDSVLHR
jgi:predicted DNA binding CopG/RHH family protein